MIFNPWPRAISVMLKLIPFAIKPYITINYHIFNRIIMINSNRLVVAGSLNEA